MTSHFKGALLGAATLVWTPAVSAQVVPPPASSDPAPLATQRETSSDADIVVTARKRSETLMSVPVVVTVQSKETLQRYNAQDLASIGELTPTVIVGNYRGQGGGTIAIRGISTPANQAGFEQAVSVAIDGVQTSNGRIAQLGFFDLQQVEVLKGPQALFFGKNSPAGVIAVTTAGPTDTLQFTAKSGYEFVANETSVEGAVSGPLTDTLKGRLAVRYRTMDGWQRNLAGPTANPFYNAATGAPIGAAQLPGTFDHRPGDDELLGRVTLTYDPVKSFSATLRVFGARSNDAGPGIATQNIGPCTGGVPRVNGIADPYGECVVDNRTTIGDLPQAIADGMVGGGDGKAYGKFTAFMTSLTIRADSGPFTLASVTGFSRVKYVDFSGLDQTTFSQLTQFEDTRQRDISQELRFSSNFTGRFNFMVGAFAQSSKLFVHTDTKLSDGAYNLTANRFTSFEPITRQDGTTKSVFGQVTINVLPTVELAGGVRYTKEGKDFDKRNLYGVGGFATYNAIYPNSPTPGTLLGKFRDDNFSPEVTLAYRPTGSLTIFGAYRTGFKSGGFGLTNPLTTTTRIDSLDFESETAKGFELGARGRWLDGKATFSFAAFDYKFSNLQVNVYDPTRIAFTISNAGAVRQRGAELEGNVEATRNLTVHGAIAYVDNQFRDFTGQCYAYSFPTGTTRASAVAPPNCSFVNATALTLQQVYDGRAPARSPKLTGNAGAILSFPMPTTRIEFTGDAFYSDSYYAADTLVSSSRQPSFWRFNASASLSQSEDRWKLALIGRNLSNRYYQLYAADRTGGGGVPGTIGEQRGVVSRGREVLLQGTVKF